MNKSKYLIILDAKSPIGGIYIDGDNDGYACAGSLKHPVLSCVQITTDAPHFISATRILKKGGTSRQTLYLPYDSVVMVVGYDEDAHGDLGFQVQPPK